MDFLSRLIGGNPAPKSAPKRAAANDPQARLARCKRIYNHFLDICNRPRNISNESPVLQQLQSLLDRLALAFREETRAPAPHLCLQFASNAQICAVISRAASVSQNEAVIRSTVDVFAALADSDEEDFLSNEPFAKSLMRLVMRVADPGGVLISVDTETAIFELLFTISAKIRLEPDILPVWFHRSVKGEPGGLQSSEKKDFVGITQKDDFPLCYLLADRVHHEGRVGDFARTGLLYIFEATGRSPDLAEWVVLSDLPTLMASGLGALYSQLSHELSILHPNANLPAVLAMSDYSTANPRPTAESAFSERHQGHMSTFLSYLAFWQDVLDHCRSPDVKQTLLDHFLILFVQQLLYPSILQSSDTDAGSSVAVLTYLTAMLESLDYPSIIHMTLTYLLDIKDEQVPAVAAPSDLIISAGSTEPPGSPTLVRKRQSLMLLTTPDNPDDAVEPSLFNLVDLVLNSIGSRSNQTAFAAMKLLSTLMTRQKAFAFGTFVKTQSPRASSIRAAGALDVEIDEYTDLAGALHCSQELADSAAYATLVEDVRYTIERQVFDGETAVPGGAKDAINPNSYLLVAEDALLSSLLSQLRTFFTNGVDVNLALTQAIIAIASCVELRLEGWVALSPSRYTYESDDKLQPKPWQAYLDDDENTSWFALHHASQRPAWSASNAPPLYTTLQTLARELETVRNEVPNLDELLVGRQNVLQATGFDGPPSSIPSVISSPTQATFLEAGRPSRGHSRSSSASSIGRGRKANATLSPLSRSIAASPTPIRRREIDSSILPTAQSIFQPPPPDTPLTTDILMRKITFPAVEEQTLSTPDPPTGERIASLNHLLTNIVVLREFVFEIVAVLQVRAAVLGEREIRCV